MGRYAQSRRRGGGGASSFPLGPPDLGDFTFTGVPDDLGAIELNWTNPIEPTAENVLIRYRGPSTGGEWFGTSALQALEFKLYATGSGGTTVETQLAWGGPLAEQLSDWSASNFTLVP